MTNKKVDIPEDQSWETLYATAAQAAYESQQAWEFATKVEAQARAATRQAFTKRNVARSAMKRARHAYEQAMIAAQERKEEGTP